MSTSGWIVVGGIAALLLYAALVLLLALAGRRTDARALAGFVPDCIVLIGRLLRERRVSRVNRFILGGLVVYLAMPIDLVPDFIPVVGQLDDALLVALALRRVLRDTDAEWVAARWPGPEASMRVVLRLAGR